MIFIYAGKKNLFAGNPNDLCRAIKLPTTVINESNLFTQHPNDTILLQMPNFGLHHDQMREPIQRLKKLYKHVIVIDIQLLLQAYIKAGADYVITNENGSFTPTKKSRFDSRLNIGMVDIAQLNRVLENADKPLLLQQQEEEMLSEKKSLYNNVKNIFLDRAEQTAHTQKEIEFILTQAKRFHAKKIFDAGCGMGRLSDALATQGFFMTGMDISDELIKKAPPNKNATYITGNLLHTNLVDDSQDLVVMMWHVICDLKGKRKELLREMNRILKHDGVLIFDFPNRKWNWQISKDGIYRHDTGFGKYISLVPGMQEIFDELLTLGFSTIEYKKVKWGIRKFVVIARKAGLYW